MKPLRMKTRLSVRFAISAGNARDRAGWFGLLVEQSTMRTEGVRSVDRAPAVAHLENPKGR